MTTPTFLPPVQPSFSPQTQHNLRLDPMSTPKGYDITRTLGVRWLDSVALEWKVLAKPELDEILSFFEGLNGAPGPFFWTPLDLVRDPLGMTPVLGDVAGGALTSQGTYFVQFAWYQSSGGLESRGSKEASFAVQDNFLLTVTVPVFPLGVTEWRIYVGAVTGDAELQAGTETTRIWTMPGTGRVAGGANPPAASTLTVPLIWRLGGGATVRKIAPNRFSLGLEFLQQTA